jgi:hypothetical protein
VADHRAADDRGRLSRDESGHAEAEGSRTAWRVAFGTADPPLKWAELPPSFRVSGWWGLSPAAWQATCRRLCHPAVPPGFLADAVILADEVLVLRVFVEPRAHEQAGRNDPLALLACMDEDVLYQC